MSDKLTIKQAISVAIKKDLPVPDETSGLVEYHSYGALDNDFLEKRVGSTVPTERHMALINEFARSPQEKDGWEVYDDCDPLGAPDEIDSHFDVFDRAALRDMQKGAPQSPILTDHDHSLGANPPMGICIAAVVTKEGRLKETWAFPKEDYNAGIRMGLSKGLIRSVSVGIFVSPKDKICNSCGDKSIYDMSCSHYPGDKDGTSVTIKRVKRYAERSLVNIPARLGTSVKGLAPAQETKELLAELGAASPEELADLLAEDKGIQPEPANAPLKEDKAVDITARAINKAITDVFSDEEKERNWIPYTKVTKALTSQDSPMVFALPLDYEEVGIQILIPEGKDLTGANPWGVQNFITDKPDRIFKFNSTGTPYIFESVVGNAIIPQLKIDHTLIPNNPSVKEGNFVLTVYVTRKEGGATPAATISPVIKEELVVTEKANEKAPEAQEPVEKEETPDTEAPAAEDPAQAPEQKSIEIPVVKELEVEELTKSFKLEVDALNKSLTEANEKFVKLAELQEKTDKDLGALTDTVKTIAEHVVKLAEFSTEEAINTLLEVAGQLKEQKAIEAPQTPPSFNDFVSNLAPKK